MSGMARRRLNRPSNAGAGTGTGGENGNGGNDDDGSRYWWRPIVCRLLLFCVAGVVVIGLVGVYSLAHQTSPGKASAPLRQAVPRSALAPHHQTSPGSTHISPPHTSPGLASVSRHKTSGKLGSLNEGGVGADFGILGVPWCRSKTGQVVEWASKDLLKGLEEFVPIYENRPITDMTVMGFDHSFGLWFVARWLKPEVIIDLGGFRGYSTWVLRQAMPETPIVFLSPHYPHKYSRMGPIYVDENCIYNTEYGYTEFEFVSWQSILDKFKVSDRSRVLLYFDDHQNHLKRISQARRFGFKHLVFGDNHDTGIGGHYSMRQICDQFYIRGGGHSCLDYSDEARIRTKRKEFWERAVGIDELCGPDEAWWGVKGEMRDFSNCSHVSISLREHFIQGRYVESVIDVYWEVPPVAGPSLTYQTRYDPARTSRPIIEDGDYRLFEQLGLNRFNTSVFNKYNQLVYVQVSPASS